MVSVDNRVATGASVAVVVSSGGKAVSIVDSRVPFGDADLDSAVAGGVGKGVARRELAVVAEGFAYGERTGGVAGVRKGEGRGPFP